VARDCHSAVATFREEWRGRGTGDAKSTGSYEGSLPVEDILDRNEAGFFTKPRDRRSWPESHSPTRITPSREGRSVKMQRSRRRARREGERGSVTRMSEARSHTDAVGRKHPRPFGGVSAEAVSEVVKTFGPPVKTARILRIRAESPPRKWRTEPGTRRGAGARSSFGWQKSIGHIACLPRRRVARRGDERGR
jgi:hypothetical protein